MHVVAADRVGVVLAQPDRALAAADLLVDGGHDQQRRRAPAASPRGRARPRRRPRPRSGTSCPASRGPTARRRRRRPTTGRAASRRGRRARCRRARAGTAPARRPRRAAARRGSGAPRCARAARPRSRRRAAGRPSCSCSARSSPGGLTVRKRTSRCEQLGGLLLEVGHRRAGYATARGAIRRRARYCERVDQLFDTGEPPRGRTPVPARARAAGRAHAPDHARRGRRPGARARPGQRAAHGDRAGPPALDGPLRAARDRARRRSRGSSPPRRNAAFEELSAVEAGRAEVRQVLERAAHRRQAARRADDLLPRRDPPLQQGPAGRAAARGRGGAA